MQNKLQKYKWHVILVFSLFVLFSAILYNSFRMTPTSAAQPVMISVKSGMSLNDIAHLLYQKGLIRNEFLFHMVVRVKGIENALQAGDYMISPNMTVQQIINMLTKGETVYRQITIPEGYNVNQIAALIDENHLGDGNKFKEIARNFAPYVYMTEHQNPSIVYKAEGYMFPDTYRIAQGTSEEQILSILLAQFDRQFTPAMRERASSLGLSINDVVILASLVEKEARLAQDRPIIAGVFLNRLKIQMPLQSCASIQYILGYPKAELTVKDTEIP